MEDYSRLAIKDYQYWQVQIHQKQSYLGRCVIWCKREDATDLADASEAEMHEFKQIVTNLKKAVIEVFQADWFNYSFLGNEERHLHCHFIPRYSSEREFAGVTFTDGQWGKNPYKRDGDSEGVSTPEVIEAVRTRIKEALD